MVSYKTTGKYNNKTGEFVLILIVVDNGLVLGLKIVCSQFLRVLILIVVDNGLVHGGALALRQVSMGS